jgi:hypothetical protein
MSLKIEQFADRPFADLVADLELGSELGGAFEYSVAFASRPSLTRDVVPKIMQFCESFTRYGTSAFITNAYGASDLPQGFARYSAIYGGAFVLDHPPETVRRADDGLLEIDIPGIGTVRTKHFITEPGAVLSTGERRLLGYREVLLLSAKLLPQDRAVGAVAPGMLGNELPVYVIQYDGVLKVCNPGMFLVHVFAMCDVKAVVDTFVAAMPQEAIVMRAAWVVTEPVPAPQEEGVVVVESPAVDDAVIGTEFFLNQAKSVLQKIAPGAAFYPAPAEEEVWIDDPAAEAPQIAADTEKASQGDATAKDAPQAETAPEAEPVSEVKPVPEAEPVPEVNPVPEPEPVPDVKPVAEPEPVPEVKPELEAEPVSRAEAVAPGDDGPLAPDGE